MPRRRLGNASMIVTMKSVAEKHVRIALSTVDKRLVEATAAMWTAYRPPAHIRIATA